MRRFVVAILIFAAICCGSALSEQGPLAKTRPIVKAKVYSAKQLEQIRRAKEGWVSNKYQRVELTPLQTAWFKSLGEPAANKSEKLGKSQGYTAAGSSQCFGPVLTRKEYRQLTREERRRFHNALNKMKCSYPDPTSRVSEYDIFVRYHRCAEAPGAHFGAGFLPWHREFLWRFESALRTHDCCVALPYWDTTLDQCLPRPAHSQIWSADYLGNNDGYVNVGDFARWSVLPECQGIGSCLRRNALQGACYKYIIQYTPFSGALRDAAAANPSTQTPPCQYLFSDADVTYVMNKLTYADISMDKDAKFETDHGLVHAFIGGHVAHIECAPSDPVYWLLHAFVDKVWEDFRRKSQMTPRETEYPCDCNGGPAHAPYAPMRPFFPLYNIHGLSNHYTNYYYRYQRSPYKCTSDEQCCSDALWCCKSSCRCRAKVRLGGDCTGLPDNACAGNCPGGGRPVCAKAGTCQVCTCPSAQPQPAPRPQQPPPPPPLPPQVPVPTRMPPYMTQTPPRRGYPMYPWYRYGGLQGAYAKRLIRK
ncbi:Tyrosinase [Lamellibrachia satsuma]|nr:Tyrosinase [Lamellibrachia satsuma]